MIFEKIREVLCSELDLDESVVTLDASIADDLGADSLDVVDIIMSLEDEFDIEVSDEDIETVKTVGDLVKYIEANT